MTEARRLSWKFLAFALLPAMTLLLSAEIAVRFKYFLAPTGHDWRYLTTPIGRGSSTPASDPQPAGNQPASDDRLVFHWQTPCVNTEVFSTELQRSMPRTWDEHCLRGDRVTAGRHPDEYRIVFLGGSTVEDAQSDEEMMTAQVKRQLPPTYRGKRVTVVNAGKANFDSRTIHAYWDADIREFSPDLVVYYEAWNEQQGDIKFTGMRMDERVAAFRGHRLHRLLYYRSMLYTYLVERFGFRMSANRFWKIDVKQLRHFVELAREVRESGARFVFVTQIVRFPRMWKGVDTFDYRAVDALLDSLKKNASYRYDVTEMSALNQRLAVAYTLDLCRQHQIPAINILDAVESLGDDGRARLFTDLGHLTVKGDALVARLVAPQLNLSEHSE